MSEFLNQCQGCQAGWELRRYTLKGISKVGPLQHLVSGGYPGERVACTRDLYIKEGPHGDWPELPDHEERVKKFFESHPTIDWKKYYLGEWNSEE